MPRLPDSSWPPDSALLCFTAVRFPLSFARLRSLRVLPRLLRSARHAVGALWILRPPRPRDPVHSLLAYSVAAPPLPLPRPPSPSPPPSPISALRASIPPPHPSPTPSPAPFFLIPFCLLLRQESSDGDALASEQPRTPPSAAAAGTGGSRMWRRQRLARVRRSRRAPGVRGLVAHLVPAAVVVVDRRQSPAPSPSTRIFAEVKSFYVGQDHVGDVPLSKKIAAGFTTGTIAICVANPTDLVKVRLKDKGKLAPGVQRRYAGAVDAYAKIVRQEGVAALWNGLGPNVARNAIINTAELASYDQEKQTILKLIGFKDDVVTHLFAGLGVVFFAVCVGSPVDVGPLAFYKGFLPNFARLGSWNVIMFLTLEQHPSD